MKNLTLIFTISLISTAFLTAQNWGGNGKIVGEGPTVEKELQLDDFKKIGLSINAKVYLKKGKQQKVTIEAQQNIIDNIKTEVRRDSWEIKFEEKVKNYSTVIINITMPTVEGLAIAGSGSIIGQDSFEGLDEIDFSIAGSGDIDFAGSAKELKISIAGSGDIKAEDFSVADCEVSIAGSGDCNISVNENLKVSIAGSGDVNYKGRPRIKSSIAGSGNLKSL